MDKKINKTETTAAPLESFFIDKVVKVVPIVRPNSWGHKYQISEDGKDKTNVLISLILHSLICQYQ